MKAHALALLLAASAAHAEVREIVVEGAGATEAVARADARAKLVRAVSGALPDPLVLSLAGDEAVDRVLPREETWTPFVDGKIGARARVNPAAVARDVCVLVRAERALRVALYFPDRKLGALFADGYKRACVDTVTLDASSKRARPYAEHARDHAFVVSSWSNDFTALIDLHETADDAIAVRRSALLDPEEDARAVVAPILAAQLEWIAHGGGHRERVVVRARDVRDAAALSAFVHTALGAEATPAASSATTPGEAPPPVNGTVLTLTAFVDGGAEAAAQALDGRMIGASRIEVETVERGALAMRLRPGADAHARGYLARGVVAISRRSGSLATDNEAAVAQARDQLLAALLADGPAGTRDYFTAGLAGDVPPVPGERVVLVHRPQALVEATLLATVNLDSYVGALCERLRSSFDPRLDIAIADEARATALRPRFQALCMTVQRVDAKRPIADIVKESNAQWVLTDGATAQDDTLALVNTATNEVEAVGRTDDELLSSSMRAVSGRFSRGEPLTSRISARFLLPSDAAGVALRKMMERLLRQRMTRWVRTRDGVTFEVPAVDGGSELLASLLEGKKAGAYTIEIIEVTRGRLIAKLNP